jgi:DNA-binding HxlR family transcriptional regulator
MAKRSYKQYCPIAYSLDVIGDRWTLLIVRELSYGPRRFTDINDGLSGMGPNLLTERFRDLEAAGILERRKPPPPAANHVYSLTEAGYELAETVVAPLGRWGMRFMNAPLEDSEYCSVVSTMWALEGTFNYQNSFDNQLSSEFRMGKDVYHVDIDGSQIGVELGPSTNPNLVANLQPRTLVSLLTHATTTNAAHAGADLSFETGSPADLDHFLQHFR